MSLSEAYAADLKEYEESSMAPTRRTLIHVEVNDVLREEIQAAADPFRELTLTSAKEYLGRALEGWLTANQAEVYKLIKGEVIAAREAELAALKGGE